MKRETIIVTNYSRLIITTIVVSIASAVLAFSLKHITELTEHTIREATRNTNPLLIIILPIIGLSLIYLLRRRFFKNRKNKGITEIYKTLDQRKDHLPLFKIPSHYLNGFLTVIFGGSTGIEVSTVVATATVGNQSYERELSPKKHKRELVCAGVTAGVAVLFGSPLAGWFFAMEVIARKMRASLIIACTVSAIVAGLFSYFFDHHRPPEYLTVKGWHVSALPFFIVLGLLSGILSAYFTILVTRMKALFLKIPGDYGRILAGTVLVGILIFLVPSLYGESYHGLNETLQNVAAHQPTSYLVLALFVLLKPLAASLTLGAGGDGGVFAPSIVSGAFLGLSFSLLCNTYFGTNLIPVNFALVGAAATLSSSILAPITSLVLVSNLAPNGYELFVPLVTGIFVSKFLFQRILPYNVYTYDFYLASRNSGV